MLNLISKIALYGMILFTLIIIGFVSMLVYALHASAHEAPTGWKYPYQCCSNMDCRQLPDGAVKEGPTGYTVPSGELINMSDPKVKESPDGLFHWCTVGGRNDGRTLCLFVPPRSY